MRKIMLLLAGVAILATSCETKGVDLPPEPGTPVISITSQPDDISVTEGEITGNLTVAASVTEGATLTYQWYGNTSASSTGGTVIDGATSKSFTIPTDLTEGAYYYFCEVGAEDAESVRSDAATVTVSTSTIPPSPAETMRYETVPYIHEPGTLGVTTTDAPDNLVFMESDGERNYYFFVLGHINSAPLAYRPAVYYGGTTPITVGYSSANVTENSISESVTEANESSVTKGSSTTWDNNLSVTAGISGGNPFVQANFETSYGHSWGGSESTDVTTARSFSNTYETSRIEASEITDEITATIGEQNEPEGMYRWSLFSTTDVYFVVVTNVAKTEIISAEISYCARPTQFWELDYDPDRGGDFGKTASGDLLTLPDMALSDLPDVEVCEHEYGPWILMVPATDRAEGTEGRTCNLCGKTETRVVPVTMTGTFDMTTATWTSGNANGRATYANNMLTVNDGAQIIITAGNGVRGSRRIEVNGNAVITLLNTNINCSLAPITVNPGATLIIRLEGSNKLLGGEQYAGIRTTGAKLTITGPGSLDVTGGYTTSWIENGAGAGIGGNGSINGNVGDENGELIIESGTVTATGGKAGNGGDRKGGGGAGAGIGGGGGSGWSETNSSQSGGAGGKITIYPGANVTANGGKVGANGKHHGGGPAMAYGGGGGGGTKDTTTTNDHASQGDPGLIDDQRN